MIELKIPVFIRSATILIIISFFLTFFDVILFSMITSFNEKVELFIIIFFSLIIYSTILLYLNKRGITLFGEKVFWINGVKRSYHHEAFKFFSEQRKLFNDVFELFTKNLHDTIKKTEESIIEFIKLLEFLHQKSKEQADLIKSSLSSGGDLITLIDKQINNNREVIESLDNLTKLRTKNLRENLDRIFILQKKVHDIVPLMDKIKEISEQINILAINAAIESARIGEKGAGFAVIADETRKLSNLTEEISQAIKDKILSLNNTMNEQYEYFSNLLTETTQSTIINQVRYSTEQIEKEFSNIGNIITLFMNNVDKKTEIVFNSVSELLGKVQFQDIVRQKLEKVCDQMMELADYNQQLIEWIENPTNEKKPPELKQLFDKFYQSYVMQSQREIHSEVFNNVPKQDNKEPKIELF